MAQVIYNVNRRSAQLKSYCRRRNAIAIGIAIAANWKWPSTFSNESCGAGKKSSLSVRRLPLPSTSRLARSSKRARTILTHTALAASSVRAAARSLFARQIATAGYGKAIYRKTSGMRFMRVLIAAVQPPRGARDNALCPRPDFARGAGAMTLPAPYRRRGHQTGGHIAELVPSHEGHGTVRGYRAVH